MLTITGALLIIAFVVALNNLSAVNRDIRAGKDAVARSRAHERFRREMGITYADELDQAVRTGEIEAYERDLIIGEPREVAPCALVAAVAR